MGLAASQARFLAITARKMNCEFQSMQIAQDKLSITRDMQKAAQDYQTALTKTKLVWDYDNDVYDLSYGVMMTPSNLNEYDPYLITDTNGRIVLTENMFTAAKDAGIINEDGSPTNKTFEGAKGEDVQTDGSRNAFLYQLGKVNHIDGTVADAIKALDNGYTKSGIGGKIFDKTKANALTTSAFINYMQNATYKDFAKYNNTTVIALNKGDKHEGYDILWNQDGEGHKAGNVRSKAGYALTEAMNVKKISYTKGATLDRDVVVKVPNAIKAEGTMYVITDPTKTYDIENVDNVEKKENGTTIDAGSYILLQKKDSKAPFDFDIYVQTNEKLHNSSDKLYELSLDDIFKDSDGNSLLVSNSKELYKDDNGKGKFYVTKNGSVVTKFSGITLGDILNGRYEISYRNKKDSYSENDGAKDVFTQIITKMAEVLGYGSAGENKGLNVDVQSDLALDQALEFTKMLLNSLYTESNNQKDPVALKNEAQKRNQVIEGDKNIYSLSLTNMLKSFLTNFAVALEGFDCGYSVEKTSTKESNYVTNDLNYYFLIKNENAMDNQTMLNADFYNMLYNQIATNGACTDSTKRQMVTDNDYLQHALKNGQLFISSLHNDGYFYQTAYSMIDEHVAEVADEEAIAQAEVEYTVTKSKLNSKEESLELQMKNLDMEISALTTEFDTVKNLISKNVEKVFTMFSS